MAALQQLLESDESVNTILGGRLWIDDDKDDFKFNALTSLLYTTVIVTYEDKQFLLKCLLADTVGEIKKRIQNKTGELQTVVVLSMWIVLFQVLLVTGKKQTFVTGYLRNNSIGGFVLIA